MNSEELIQDQEEAIQRIAEWMSFLEPEERLVVIDAFNVAVGGIYCLHCGREHGVPRCQCWNDQ